MRRSILRSIAATSIRCSVSAAGYAFADYEATAGWAGAVVTRSKTLDGPSLGAGIEYLFGRRWAVRGEYVQDDFGTTTIEGTAEIFDRFHSLETRTFRLVLAWQL